MKVYICGCKEHVQTFSDTETALREQGHIPINPVKLLHALPGGISHADFTVVAFEIIRISDAILLLDGWDKDLMARMELAHAKRLEKERYPEAII